MAKAQQGQETKKPGYELTEYDQLILDLDFIVASLQVATDHESEVFDAGPIFYEALNKAITSRAVVEKMHDERQVKA